MTNNDPPLDITIRAGLEFVYTASAPTPILLLIKPRLDRWQHIEKEQLSFEPHVAMEEHEDEHGNRPPLRARAGRDAHPARRVRRGAVGAGKFRRDRRADPVEELSLPLLRYTLPSRYCDSDKLLNFAFEKFGNVPHGLQRAGDLRLGASHIEYRFGSGSPFTAASEIIAQGFGVCRDSRTAIALCRTFNLPARYVTGYVPDVGFPRSGSPMDFHAYFQVYVGSRWQTFDARFNVRASPDQDRLRTRRRGRRVFHGLWRGDAQLVLCLGVSGRSGGGRSR